MGTTGINALNNNISPNGGISSGQSAWDNHETSIRNQIKRLQDEMKNLSKDDKLSEEQKARQKQAMQEEIQSLNSELRQYQIQKRQEEVREKQNEAKPESQKADKKDADESRREFGSEQLGVIITISLSKDQVTNLEKVRKDLEGRQRTAGTEDEKEKLQKKIDNVSKDIGQKIVITENSLMNSQKDGKFGVGIIGGEDDSEKDDDRILAGRKMIENQNEPFENVSVIMK